MNQNDRIVSEVNQAVHGSSGYPAWVGAVAFVAFIFAVLVLGAAVSEGIDALITLS